MHDDRQLIEGRLLRTLQRIEDAVWSSPVPVDLASWEAPGEPVPVAEGLAAAYEPAHVGQRWGAPWGTTWFRVRVQVPESHAGRPVDLRLDLGFDPDRTGFHVEGLVYRADGTPVKGLNPRNQWVRVADTAKGGEEVELFVEAASNPLLLGGGGFDFRPPRSGTPRPPDASRGTASSERSWRSSSRRSGSCSRTSRCWASWPSSCRWRTPGGGSCCAPSTVPWTASTSPTSRARRPRRVTS